jgi:hypothetical protein
MSHNDEFIIEPRVDWSMPMDEIKRALALQGKKATEVQHFMQGMTRLTPVIPLYWFQDKGQRYVTCVETDREFNGRAIRVTFDPEYLVHLNPDQSARIASLEGIACRGCDMTGNKGDIAELTPDGEGSTSWEFRFSEALRVLCGGVKPPDEFLKSWLNDQDSIELQEWVVNNCVLHWAMGITTIEAAMALADQPDEGGIHYPKNQKG